MSEARRLWPILLVSGLLLGSVWLHVQATLMGYRASEARGASRSLRARNAYLRLEADRLAARDRIAGFVLGQGLTVQGVMQSPVTGQDGNVEYLLVARMGAAAGAG